MKTLFLLGVTVIAIVALLAGGFFRSFKAKSESVLDKSVGMNGSFEITKSGLPVNWLIYTQKTISTGDYDFIIDSEQYKSGTQSLKFVVRACSPDGGWHSPGFSQEYDAIPATVYKVSFWVKNDGAEFRVKVGGITGDKGRYETIVKSSENFATWTQFEHKYTIPPKFNRIRIELNVLKSGIFWIDDVEISGISN